MTRNGASRAAPPRPAIGLLSMLAGRDADPLVGDLAEECALRRASSPSFHASWWCWRQAWLSAPPLLLAGIRRGRWLSTLAVAVLAWAVVRALVAASDVALARLLAGNPVALELISFTGFLLATMLGGYLAARIRRRAGIVLAALVLLMSAISLTSMAPAMPLWEQAVVLVAGPSASMAGACFRGVNPRRAARV